MLNSQQAATFDSFSRVLALESRNEKNGLWNLPQFPTILSEARHVSRVSLNVRPLLEVVRMKPGLLCRLHDIRDLSVV